MTIVSAGILHARANAEASLGQTSVLSYKPKQVQLGYFGVYNGPSGSIGADSRYNVFNRDFSGLGWFHSFSVRTTLNSNDAILLYQEGSTSFPTTTPNQFGMLPLAGTNWFDPEAHFVSRGLWVSPEWNFQFHGGVVPGVYGYSQKLRRLMQIPLRMDINYMSLSVPFAGGASFRLRPNVYYATEAEVPFWIRPLVAARFSLFGTYRFADNWGLSSTLIYERVWNEKIPVPALASEDRIESSLIRWFNIDGVGSGYTSLGVVIPIMPVSSEKLALFAEISFDFNIDVGK